MGGEAVLRDAGLGAGLEEFVLEAGFHHPPADEALEADQAADAEETAGHALIHSFSGHEI